MSESSTAKPMPSALRANARWQKLGPSSVPALLVHPSRDSGQSVPVVMWMHGRTADKELDPGRYLRWMRAGLGVCAVDMPGHGERFDGGLQSSATAFAVIAQMVGEIDGIITALDEIGGFDIARMAIGGMSLGGLAALARLCQPHSFRCASVEATTGCWWDDDRREHFRQTLPAEVFALNPIEALDGWREIPVQAIHAERDEWAPFARQEKFINALRSRYCDPSLIEFIAYERTGAPHEHIGFGKMSADAKDRQRDFLKRWLEHPAVA